MRGVAVRVWCTLFWLLEGGDDTWEGATLLLPETRSFRETDFTCSFQYSLHSLLNTDRNSDEPVANNQLMIVLLSWLRK